MTSRTDALPPAIGSVVTGHDLSADMSERTVRSLIGLLFDRGVIVIKPKHLTTPTTSASPNSGTSRSNFHSLTP